MVVVCPEMLVPVVVVVAPVVKTVEEGAEIVVPFAAVTAPTSPPFPDLSWTSPTSWQKLQSLFITSTLRDRTTPPALPPPRPPTPQPPHGEDPSLPLPSSSSSSFVPGCSPTPPPPPSPPSPLLVGLQNSPTTIQPKRTTVQPPGHSAIAPSFLRRAGNRLNRVAEVCPQKYDAGGCLGPLSPPFRLRNKGDWVGQGKGVTHVVTHAPENVMASSARPPAGWHFLHAGGGGVAWGWVINGWQHPRGGVGRCRGGGDAGEMGFSAFGGDRGRGVVLAHGGDAGSSSCLVGT